MTHLRVVVEAVPKRAFASAVDWPGWSRAGRTPEQAIETVLAYAARYAVVAADAGFDLPDDAFSIDVVETLEGDASTEFGVPGKVTAADRAPLDVAEAARRASLLTAAWRRFDSVAAAAPESLRKGPRGGGRDRSKIVAHVIEADHGYTRELGIRVPAADPANPASIAVLRGAMLEVLSKPSDGRPIAKRWTTRYAQRRIAWHALDHAWEIEDRSEP